MQTDSLETAHPELFSHLRRSLNGLREKETSTRRQAITDLLRMVKQSDLSALHFDEVLQMGNKDLLKCLSDSSEWNREHALQVVLELVPRVTAVAPFLPYIFALLIDRTNCNDLEGIAALPEKMRPAPGQKPKVLIKLVEPCEEIRLLYCTLMRKILSLVEEHEIRDKLDEIVNILRALIMDPSPQIQKNACETLEYFCKTFRMILLHYTELMGRAVLLPLVSKKSKIRIAGLNALTAVFWCGLWKYNAFVFENLIGFRDPNSVPIKDFYEPSHNINYLATFVNDANVRVRQEFMKSIKIWTCTLDDKYDHHGRLVPYIMSGLFDKDDEVRNTALETIAEIGKQIEEEKEKEFRESKQYAIDAAWTWEGKLVGLPVDPPILVRPSLGSRVFIRGHVRKFWSALYKQIKDIHLDNRRRAAFLVLYGTIYTENYMTQYLDVLIPHLLTSLIPASAEDEEVAQLLQRSMFFLGRYCEVSTYLHIMTSAIKGELVQNEEFLKAALVGLTRLVEGCFEAIPSDTGLGQKRTQIEQLIGMIEDCSICSQIYRGNSQESLNLVLAILKGIQTKATPSESLELMQTHVLSILKLFAVSYYEHYYGHLAANQTIPLERGEYAYLREKFELFGNLYPDYFSVLDGYMREAYMNPPSLMDADWKLIIVIHNYLTQSSTEDESLIFQLAQEVVSESLSLNRSIQILSFLYKYIGYLFQQVPEKVKLSKLHLVLIRSLQNFSQFKPIKKIPIYDQHLVRPDPDTTLIRIPEDIFIPLFISCSQAIQSFYLHKIQIPSAELGKIIYGYLNVFHKFVRDKTVLLHGIKTLWLIFERAEMDAKTLAEMVFDFKEEKIVVFEKVLDSMVTRLETIGDPDRQKLNMIFDILGRCFSICPKIPDVTTKLPTFYANYPQLMDTLIKYAMDEKDMQTKEKYRILMMAMCSKLRPWFELQARLSEQQRIGRANFLKSILDKTR